MAAQKQINQAGLGNSGGSRDSSRSLTGEKGGMSLSAANSPLPTGFTAGRMPDGDPPDLTLWGSEEWGDSSAT